MDARAQAAVAGAIGDRRRFVRAAAAGSVISLAAFVVMLAGPHFDLLHGRGILDTFTDAQARALMHGRLWVTAAQASIEGFSLRGHSYLYFGLWPSVLRIPLLAVTHALDGRLTQPSMLLAFVVLMVGSATLHWQVRGLVRPGEPVGARDAWAAAGIQVLVGTASVVLFLAGWPVIYHELELWGAALAVAGLSAAVAVAVRPTGRRIAVAGLVALLAIQSRPTSGLAPALALLGLWTGLAAREWGSRPDGASRERPPGMMGVARALGELGPRGETPSRRTLVGLLAAGLIGPVTYILVQYAKFRTLGLPVDHQVGVQLDPVAQAAVAANHGSLFGLKYVPSTLLAATRPDAVGTTRGFPFLGIPHQQPVQVGHALLESVQPSLSATTSMPLMCLLTVVGLIAVIRRRDLRPLPVLLAAAAAAYLPVLTVSDIATRYMSDAVPLLLLGSVIGAHVLFGSRRPRPRTPAVILTVAAGLLAAWSVVVNAGAALVLQRVLAPDIPASDRAAFVNFQESVDNLLGRSPAGLAHGPRLPTRATGAPADLFIVGSCAGMYATALDNTWVPVERTPRTGLHVLTAARPSSLRPQALLSLGRPGDEITLVVAGPARAARFSIRVARRTVGGAPTVALARRSRITLSIDPFARADSATVSVGGRRLFAAQVPDINGPQTIGADSGDPSLARASAKVSPVPLTAPVCRRIAAAAHLRLR